MATYGVTPSIRVQDIARALSFYEGTLGFDVLRGGPDDGNVSLGRGAARLMLETPGSFYAPAYNEAIRARTGTPSAMALYMEADDLADLYGRLAAAGLPIVDPLADRDWGQAEFTVADPEGNWLTFYKPLAGQGSA